MRASLVAAAVVLAFTLWGESARADEESQYILAGMRESLDMAKTMECHVTAHVKLTNGSTYSKNYD